MKMVWSYLAAEILYVNEVKAVPIQTRFCKFRVLNIIIQLPLCHKKILNIYKKDMKRETKQFTEKKFK